MNTLLTADIGHPLANSSRILPEDGPEYNTVPLFPSQVATDNEFTTVPIEETQETVYDMGPRNEDFYDISNTTVLQRETENINRDADEIIDNINEGNIEQAENLIQTENINQRLENQPLLEEAIRDEERNSTDNGQNNLNPTRGEREKTPPVNEREETLSNQSPIKGEKEKPPRENETILSNWSGDVEKALDTPLASTTVSNSVEENINSMPAEIDDLLPSNYNNNAQQENLNNPEYDLGNVSTDRIILDSVAGLENRMETAIDSAISVPAGKKGQKQLKSVTDNINDVSRKMKEGIPTRSVRKALEKLGGKGGKVKVSVQLEGANRITNSELIEKIKKRPNSQSSRLQALKKEFEKEKNTREAEKRKKEEKENAAKAAKEARALRASQMSKQLAGNRKRERDPNASLLPEDEAIDKVTKFKKVSAKTSKPKASRPVKRNLDSKETQDRKKNKQDESDEDDPMK